MKQRIYTCISFFPVRGSAGFLSGKQRLMYQGKTQKNLQGFETLKV